MSKVVLVTLCFFCQLAHISHGWYIQESLQVLLLELKGVRAAQLWFLQSCVQSSKLGKLLDGQEILPNIKDACLLNCNVSFTVATCLKYKSVWLSRIWNDSNSPLTELGTHCCCCWVDNSKKRNGFRILTEWFPTPHLKDNVIGCDQFIHPSSQFCFVF